MMATDSFIAVAPSRIAGNYPDGLTARHSGLERTISAPALSLRRPYYCHNNDRL